MQYEIKTNMGTMRIELDAKKAPNTVKNFINYAESDFYNGTLFHRVIPNFMIQGGGFEPGLKEKQTQAPIENEADNGLQNQFGTIAMARTNDPHSATSQFFINTTDNAFLNFKNKSGQGWGYCVFGKIVDGENVLRAISQVRTGNVGMHENVPLEDVLIESITAYVDSADDNPQNQNEQTDDSDS